MWRLLLPGLFMAWSLEARADEPQTEPKRPQFERLLEGDDARRAAALAKKVAQAQEAMKYDAVLSLTEELFALRTRVQGPDHWETLNEKFDLPTYRILSGLPADELAVWGKARQRNEQANAFRAKREFEKALPLLEEYCRDCERFFGANNPDTAISFNNLSVLFDALGRHADALAANRKAVEIIRELFGENHPSTARTYETQSRILNHQNNYADAHSLRQKAYGIRREVLGEKHPVTTQTFDSLIENLASQIHADEMADRYDDAIQHTEELLAWRLKVQGADHWQTVNARWDLDALRKVAVLPAEGQSGWRKSLEVRTKAQDLRAKKQYAQAELLFREYRRQCVQVFGGKHPLTAGADNFLGIALDPQKKYAEAILFYREAIAIGRETKGERHPETATYTNNLGVILNVEGQYAEARMAHQAAFEVRREVLGDKHPDTVKSFSQLIDDLNSQIAADEKALRYDEAVRISEDVLGWRAKVQGADYWETVNARWALDTLRIVAALPAEGQLGWRAAIDHRKQALKFTEKGEHAKAEPLYRTYQQRCVQVFGENHPHTGFSDNLLAVNLNAQRKYAEAGSYYDKALQIDREQKGDKNLDTATCANNLGSNLLAQGKFAEAQAPLELALAVRQDLLGEKNDNTVLSYNRLGFALDKQKKFREARPYYQKALDLGRELNGAKVRNTVVYFGNLVQCLDNLANETEQADNYADAVRFVEEQLTLRSEAQGADHWETVNARWRLDALRKLAALPAEERSGWRKALKERILGEELKAKGQNAQAETHFREYRRQCVQVFGGKHPFTGDASNLLGVVVDAQKKYPEAIALYREALSIGRETKGEKHPDTAQCSHNLGIILKIERQHGEARVAHEAAFEIRRQVLGDKHPDTVKSFNQLIDDLTSQIGADEKAVRNDDAVKHCEELLAWRVKVQGADHWETVNVRWTLDMLRKLAALPAEGQVGWRAAIGHLARALKFTEKGEHAKAEPLYRSYRQRCVQVFGEKHPHTAHSDNLLAVNLNAQKKYTQAGPYYEKALEIDRESKGDKNLDTAICANNLGSNLLSQGKFAEAQSPLELALAARRDLLGEKHGDTVLSYNRLGFALDKQKKFREARSYYQTALELGRELNGANDRNTVIYFGNLAQCLSSLADEADQADNYGDAIRFFEDLLALRTEVQGADHWETIDARWGADVFRKVGDLPDEERSGWRKAVKDRAAAWESRTKGQHAQSEPRFREYQRWCIKVFGERHPQTAGADNWLAIILFDRGEIAEATVLYRQALDIMRQMKGDKHPDIANGHDNLGFVFKAERKYPDAESHFQKCLEIRRDVFGEKHANTIEGYDHLAVCLDEQNKHAQSQPLHESILEVRRELHGEKDVQTLIGYDKLADVLQKQGKYAEAWPLYQKVLGLRRTVHGEKHPDTASGYSHLASILAAESRFADALPLYEKALQLRLGVLGETHTDVATSYNDVACTLSALGKYGVARLRFQKALDLRHVLFGETGPNIVLSYNNLGANLDDLRKPSDARPLFEKALAICRDVHGEKHSETATIYNNLACNLDRQGKYVEAQPLHEKALDLRRELLGEKDRQTATSYANLGHNLTGQGKFDEAWPLLVKSAAVYEAARLNMTDRSCKRTAFSREQSPYRLLAATLARRGAPAAAWNAAETELGGGLVAAGAALQEVQEVIPDDAALILWVDVADGYGLREHWGCVVRRTGEPHWQALSGSGPNGDWTDADFSLSGELRSALTSLVGAPRVEELAQKLYPQRLAPLAPHLAGVTTLYVVGANTMAGVPIDVLTREFIVSYLPSGSYLARLSKRPSVEENSLLAIGDPTVTRLGSDSAVTQVSLLPSARVEVTQIGKLFGNRPTILFGPAASEEALDERRRTGDLAHFRYLHIATPGASNDVTTCESLVHLAHDARVGPEPQHGSPTLDGHLTAREVLEFWKLNADLVTLSSGQTGSSPLGENDGVFGFAQAFLTAGSRAVCLSTRNVNETATALLMMRFYQNLLGRRPGLDKPLPKAMALAEAKEWLRELSAEDSLKFASQLTKGVARNTPDSDADVKQDVPRLDPNQLLAPSIKPFAHPFYWSGFMLIGDPN